MNIMYYYGQDGEIANNELINLFNLSTKELRYSDKIKQNVFDITGFVFSNKKILTIFPKHYFKSEELSLKNQSNEYLKEDIKLLINVIKKYCKISNSSAFANSYIGASDIFDSDYPFKQFYKVYDYFKKYGIYKEKNTYIKKGYSGKIHWKTVINQSNKFISNNNLILMPLYVVKKKHNDVFLTECMAFIINYTIDYFQDFLELKKIDINYHFDIFNNTEYVITQLKNVKNKLFKDAELTLVQNMIEFFESFHQNARGGNVHIRIRHFNMIWQKMIEEYINNHFLGINENDGSAIFTTPTQKSSITFAPKIYNNIDASEHQFSINIDHLAHQNNKLYIFDSKYYTNIGELNYKQIAYNEILKYYYPDLTGINNILFLPGNEPSSNLHFLLSSQYIGKRKLGIKIIEQYLPPKTIMQTFMNINN